MGHIILAPRLTFVQNHLERREDVLPVASKVCCVIKLEQMLSAAHLLPNTLPAQRYVDIFPFLLPPQPICSLTSFRPLSVH